MTHEIPKLKEYMSRNGFTDDDLRRLKEEVHKNNCVVLTEKGLLDLLARLECAENHCGAVEKHEDTMECIHPKCGHNFICDECRNVIATREAWRASKGESI